MSNSEQIKPKKKRGYFVCENCGGLYELQEGESPEDFESCECGGKLLYTKDPRNLSNHTNISQDKNASKLKNESLIDEFVKKLNLRALIIGFIIVIILSYLTSAFPITFLNAETFNGPRIISLFISSVIVGYLVDRDYSVAAINGGIIGIIPTFYYTISMEPTPILLDLFIYIIFGAIAGIIGMLIKSSMETN